MAQLGAAPPPSAASCPANPNPSPSHTIVNRNVTRVSGGFPPSGLQAMSANTLSPFRSRTSKVSIQGGFSQRQAPVPVPPPRRSFRFAGQGRFVADGLAANNVRLQIGKLSTNTPPIGELSTNIRPARSLSTRNCLARQFCRCTQTARVGAWTRTARDLRIWRRVDREASKWTGLESLRVAWIEIFERRSVREASGCARKGTMQRLRV